VAECGAHDLADLVLLARALRPVCGGLRHEPTVARYGPPVTLPTG